MTAAQHDVIVIGAGLAGLRAARDLAEQGLGVLVLEARERIGGRGWTSTFPGTDVAIELGGAWFTAHQQLVRSEVTRYGLGVREFIADSSTRWRTDGELRLDAPAVAEDPVTAAAMHALTADVTAIRNGSRDSRFTLSLDSYLDAIDASGAVRDLAYGWWTITGGSRPSEGCVEGLLGALAIDGAIGDMRYLQYSPQPGWSALAQALADTDGIDLELGQPVLQVFHDQATVTVRTARSTVTASACVVAIPVNVWPNVAFEPALPARVSEAAGASSGRAVKVWMLASGVPDRALGYGRGNGLHWLYGDREVGGHTLVVGFGWDDPAFDPDDTYQVALALRTFFPDAELIDHTWHNWVGDDASLGTWANPMAGRPELLDPARFEPVGPVAFATSDIATEHAGWFEGALVSGSAAAAAIAARLS